jgi:ABC-type dipeptide/oligopeptide/nickel transport system ATPase component
MYLALAFISHDLSVVRSVCQRVIVMREGRVIEEGPCERVFATPRTQYTRLLIDAIPLPTVDPGWLARGASPETAATAKAGRGTATRKMPEPKDVTVQTFVSPTPGAVRQATRSGRKKRSNSQLRAQDRAWREQQKRKL